MKQGDIFSARSGDYVIQKRLGKGKSGISYLVRAEKQSLVLKLMHDEPCPYYDFQNQNKVEIEVRAYQRLSALNLSVPELLEWDEERGYLLKPFIDGPVMTRVIAEGGVTEAMIGQLFQWSAVLEQNQINIDYFPANFVLDGDALVYIDYEINSYQPAWNFENWGIYYYANQAGMKQFLETGDAAAINQDAGSGIPVKAPFEAAVARWISICKK